MQINPTISSFTNVTGTNTFANGASGAQFGFVVNEGIVNLGGAGQVNALTGNSEMIVGTINDATLRTTELNINGGTTTVGNYIGVGRGNGTANASTILSINNDAAVSSGNFAIGYANGVVGYKSSPTVNFNGSSTYTDSGVFTVGESVNATGGVSTITVNGTAVVSLTNVSNTAVNIGASGAAVFDQNGGSVTTAGRVNMARDATSAAIYTLDGGILTAPAIAKGAGTATFTFNGGTLKPTTNDLSGGGLGTFLTGVTTNVGNAGAFIDTNGFSVAVATSLVPDGASTGGLTKQGLGTLAMTAPNTYTGDTTVSAGTLELQVDDSLENLANVKLATGSFLKLNFSGTDTVSRLYINNVEQAAGVWGRTGSIVALGATHESALIEGDGLLQVTNGAGGLSYASWASANAGSQLADNDYDLDGVRNGVEYFMGATGSTFTANPALVSGTVTWPKSASFSGTYKVETSTDLVNWADVTGSVVPGVGTISYTPPSGDPARFVRLDVVPN